MKVVHFPISHNQVTRYPVILLWFIPGYPGKFQGSSMKYVMTPFGMHRCQVTTIILQVILH